MSGLKQTEQYAALSTWQPDQLAGFKVGDTVDIPTLGRCLVVALIPPALLQVTTSSGGIAKVGWRVCRRVECGGVQSPNP